MYIFDLYRAAAVAQSVRALALCVLIHGVVTAPLPNVQHTCEGHGSSEMNIIKG